MRNLGNDQHIVRFVKPSQVNKLDDGTAVGITPQAFELRQDETGLSTTWREFYPGTRIQQLKAVKAASLLTMRPNAAFASLMVGDAHEACHLCRCKVRIVHDAKPGEPAHSSILQLPREDDVLRALLANLASQDFEQVKNL